ncbi:hypothetical protein [Methanimicrococcus hacksteinii]|nr:hypothetical protein [Methanimicrococcus sp. At1]
MRIGDSSQRSQLKQSSRIRFCLFAAAAVSYCLFAAVVVSYCLFAAVAVSTACLLQSASIHICSFSSHPLATRAWAQITYRFLFALLPTGFCLHCYLTDSVCTAVADSVNTVADLPACLLRRPRASCTDSKK